VKSLNYVFGFGMHKGVSLATVIKDDVGYIRWCLKNIEDFNLDVKAKAAYKKSLKSWEREEEDRRSDYYGDKTPI
jgi:hypothetical protein